MHVEGEGKACGRQPGDVDHRGARPSDALATLLLLGVGGVHGEAGERAAAGAVEAEAIGLLAGGGGPGGGGFGGRRLLAQ